MRTETEEDSIDADEENKIENAPFINLEKSFALGLKMSILGLVVIYFCIIYSLAK